MKAASVLILLGSACAAPGLLLRGSPTAGAVYEIRTQTHRVTHTGEEYESQSRSTARVEQINRDTKTAVIAETTESQTAGRRGQMEPSTLGVGETRRTIVDLRGIVHEPCDAVSRGKDCADQRPTSEEALTWTRVLDGSLTLPEKPLRPGSTWVQPVVPGEMPPWVEVTPAPLVCRMHGIEATPRGSVVHLSCHSSGVERIKSTVSEIQLEIVQRLDLHDAFVGETEVRATKHLNEDGHPLGKETEITVITIRGVQ